MTHTWNLIEPDRKGLWVFSGLKRTRLGLAALTLVLTSALGGPSYAAPVSQAPTPPAARCSLGSGPFVPTLIQAGGFNARVLALPRSAGGVPGVPSVSTGKFAVGWDKPGFWPGSARGHVLMNAHAWPDDTALGDLWQRQLFAGNIIKVWNRNGTRIQCYQVTSRGEYVANQATARWYYGNARSAPALALAVCSGVRLGPGHYTGRTIWVATPIR